MADPEESSSKEAPEIEKEYTPLITIIDSPEDPVIDNDTNEEKEEEFKMCSPQNNSNRPAPPLSFTSKLFRPPQLNPGNGTNNLRFTLNPSKLNPFAAKLKEETNGDKSVTNGEPVKFVPLIPADKKEVPVERAPSAVTSTTSFVTSTTSFVFGEKLEERVVTDKEVKPSTSTNGTADMLFSNVKSDAKTTTKEVKSLSESAREYEESRAVKRKYEEVEVKTGEEEETNILNISCKLFAFDGSNSSWQERGRGILRLNDFEGDSRVQSRLVFRTSGSFRVILNTKIFAKMTVERASERSVRLTALDANGEIKVFLVMSSIEDSKSLFIQLKTRITKEIEAVQDKTSTQKAAK